ncbi:MAG: alanine--tRNA ligase-related protein [Hespellia sp.]|nr:alanine--tRNA ligase-related protein [Hespellia sp.]
METTKKLYDNDAYATDFTAKVVSCEKKKKKSGTVYEVVLDKTLFFPEEGGQSADLGTINGIQVLDVQIKKDVITHTLGQAVAVGDSVEGKVDWTHRFYNMQQHTGEHIVSGLVHRHFGYDNVGFHLSDQVVTMDFNGPLSEEQIAMIEQEANEVIIKNVEVQVLYPSQEELKTLEYRSKIEIDGQVRIINIPGCDTCACCATHVRRTGEIGMLKVIQSQNYKGGMRIFILCGFRALNDYREKFTSVQKISNLLSVRQEEVFDATEKLKNNLQETKQALADTKKEFMNYKIAALKKESKNVCLFEADLEADVMRSTVNTLVEKFEGFCGIFTGNDSQGYRYIIGSKTEDARKIGNLLKEKFSARGGGKPEMIQGSLTAAMPEIEKVFEEA